MKQIMETLDHFLRFIHLIDLRPDMYEANVVFFIMGWVIFTTGNVLYTFFSDRRSHFNFISFSLLNIIILLIVNQIYFLLLLTIFSLLGPISLVIVGIIYIVFHFVICDDNTDLWLFGISRSIDAYLDDIDDYYYKRAEYKRFHQSNLNFYQNFIKNKNI